MFSNVGWGEILVLLIVGLLLIGPERLPHLIKEVRAVLLAARNAVTQAREQLDGELGEDFKEFSKPLRELNSVRHMGAKGFITKTLLDGDDSFLTPFAETKQDLKDTVDSVRRPQDAVTAGASKNTQALPASQGDSHAESTTQVGTGTQSPSAAEQPEDANRGASTAARQRDNDAVEVAQQADLGESWKQDELPIEAAAHDLTSKKNQGSPTLSWDDVL